MTYTAAAAPLSADLSSLVILMILALAVPIVVSRLPYIRLPIVAGEIIVGMAVGRSGLNLIQPDPAIEFLTFFGLAYLMFISGLEIDFNVLLRPLKVAEGQSFISTLISHPVAFGHLALGATLVGGLLFSTFLQQAGLVGSALLMAVIISTTSLTVVLPVLKESGLLKTDYGQTLLTGAVVADFVTLILLSVAASLFVGGLSSDILMLLVLLALVAVSYRMGKTVTGLKLEFLETLLGGTAQLGVRAALALMLIFIFIAETVGAEAILGTFLAGVLVSLLASRQRSELHEKMDAIGFGFLVPIFFIMVGVNFDVGILLTNPQGLALVPLILVATYLLKGLPVLALRLIYGWRETLAASLLLSTQMSVTIAAAAVGLRIGAISETVQSAIVLVAIVTSIVSPVAFNKLAPSPPEEENRKKEFGILGTNKHARLLATNLTAQGYRVTLLDSNRRKVEAAQREGFNATWADIRRPETLAQDGQEFRFDGFIAVTGNDQINIEAARVFSEGLGTEDVFAIVHDAKHVQLAERLGIRAINPFTASVGLANYLLRNPGETALEKEAFQCDDVEVRSPDYTGVALRELQLPHYLLVFSVRRGEERLLPDGDTVLQEGDHVLVVGPKEAVKEWRGRMGRREPG